MPDNATDKTVKWSSADNTIATVDNNGLITGVKEGNVNLSVTSNDGKVVSTIAVKVYTPVTGITVSPDSVALKVGDTSKVTSTIAPANATNKIVTWSSDDATIASVADDGTITGVKEGTTNISVITQDGSKKASVAVTVSPAS